MSVRLRLLSEILLRIDGLLKRTAYSTKILLNDEEYSVKYVLKTYQDQIAQKALDSFTCCWKQPYIFHSDSEWADIFKNARENQINFLNCREFVTDYGLMRAFRWKKPRPDEIIVPNEGFLRVLEREIRAEKPDPISLANNWVKEGVFTSRQVSAASKFLFFLCPDARLAIFDSRACTAIKERFKSALPGERQSLNFKNTSNGFQDYVNGVLDVVSKHNGFWMATVSEYHQEHPHLNTNFFLRRIADKHLYFEGVILDKYRNKNNPKPLDVCVKNTLS